jgi:hypothetical protein
MAEIIQIREFQVARDRAQRGRADHTSVMRAIELFRQNIAAVANLMCSAPEDQQPELLDRLDKLTAMLRYAIRARDTLDAPLTGNS